jgi:hypothetical protein
LKTPLIPSNPKTIAPKEVYLPPKKKKKKIKEKQED